MAEIGGSDLSDGRCPWHRADRHELRRIEGIVKLRAQLKMGTLDSRHFEVAKDRQIRIVLTWSLHNASSHVAESVSDRI